MTLTREKDRRHGTGDLSVRFLTPDSPALRREQKVLVGDVVGWVGAAEADTRLVLPVFNGGLDHLYVGHGYKQYARGWFPSSCDI